MMDRACLTEQRTSERRGERTPFFGPSFLSITNSTAEAKTGSPLCISFFDRFHLCNKLAEYCCRNRWFQICFFPFSLLFFHFSLDTVLRTAWYYFGTHTSQTQTRLLSAVPIPFPTRADYYSMVHSSNDNPGLDSPWFRSIN
ncbi:hypothetical protein ASPBRDRAFT_242137 [Aspergillus brasiliensis CBS 101740]|uniref:Uncharacterized protein n=1 Tax=Aspergillus brasiliensis (strain CBS 101740 / IMI 381727 / IBT 21946) TaxID=767769 RepID=A0A1L9V114_ASPBC|nr:hypothetical protein ASPBRDRAFT_242137 [Aspergillus brasiliensis CBS 101740]